MKPKKHEEGDRRGGEGRRGKREKAGKEWEGKGREREGERVKREETPNPAHIT